LEWPGLLVCLGWLAVIWLLPDAEFAICYDDAYYYCQIARNLLAGYGSTFDRINFTNGYHPLWLGVCLLIYGLGLTGEFAVKTLLTLQVAMWAWVLVQSLAMVRESLGDWPGASLSPGPSQTTASLNETALPLDPEESRRARLWLSLTLAGLPALLTLGPMFTRVYVNGLESALYAVFYVQILSQALRWNGDWITSAPRRARWTLALLGTLAFLARTDAGLLLLCLGLWSLPSAFRLGRTGLLRLVEAFLLPACTIIGFLIYNHFAFGIAMQVSGELKRVPPDLFRGTCLVFALLTPVLVWALLQGEVGRKFPRLRTFLARTAWFGVFVALTFAYYVGLQTFPRSWYFGPAGLYGLVGLCIATADLLAGALAEAKPTERPTASLIKLAILLISVLAVGAGFQMHSQIEGSTVAMFNAHREAGRWIGRSLPADARIGCWDAGVLGYYTPQSVINLDGVVNSGDYLRALQTGQTAEFLRRAGLDYVANHAEITPEEAGPDLRESATGLLGPEVTSRWHLENRWDFTYAGALNNQQLGFQRRAVLLYRLPSWDPVGRPPAMPVNSSPKKE